MNMIAHGIGYLSVEEIKGDLVAVHLSEPYYSADYVMNIANANKLNDTELEKAVLFKVDTKDYREINSKVYECD